MVKWYRRSRARGSLILPAPFSTMKISRVESAMMDLIPKSVCPGWTEAEAHLSRVDPVLAKLIQQVGPCSLSPRKDHFGALCQSILNQQISVAAARTVWDRFRKLFPRHRPIPAALLLLSDEQLRGAGLSRQKAGYLRSLAEHFSGSSIPPRKLKRMTDEEVVQSLLPVRGIGRWTAEMFLIFVLNRTDLLPVDDLGLCTQIMRAYGIKKYPDAKTVIRLGEKWRPYRSIATWYLWRSQTFLKAVAAEGFSPAPSAKVSSKKRSRTRSAAATIL
jgi:DNA-3-methyladenine glycosylase II